MSEHILHTNMRYFLSELLFHTKILCVRNYVTYENILTSKRNAPSKTFHNLLLEHHTCAKVWSILIFGCLSLYKVLKIWFSLSKLGWAHHFKRCTGRSWHKCFYNEISQKPLKVVLKTRNHQNFEKRQATRGKNHNDIGTLAMLKYGRNEKKKKKKKMTFCVFYWSQTT